LKKTDKKPRKILGNTHAHGIQKKKKRPGKWLKKRKVGEETTFPVNTAQKKKRPALEKKKKADRKSGSNAGKTQNTRASRNLGLGTHT